MVEIEKGTLRLLDCTLRDGGQCLESNQKFGLHTAIFTDEDKLSIAEKVRDSGIDIIEIGSISESTGRNKKQIAIYSGIKELSEFLPQKKNKDQIYTGIFVDPDIPEKHIPNYSEEFIDGTRVILRYSELRKSLDFCEMLSKKGYKVFIQPMLTMRYSDEDIHLLIEYANCIKAEALYIVDSFGYMYESDLERIYEKFKSGLDKGISIGFHAHNNMERAFSNTRFFVERLVDRDCIIDGCVLGMGQGAGNLQTEVAAHYLNTEFDANYEMNCILDVCDCLDKFRKNDLEAWGYSALRFVPAIHRTAYKYAIAMRTKYKMSLRDINDVLSDIPEKIRNRYTTENMEYLLNLKGHRE